MKPHEAPYHPTGIPLTCSQQAVGVDKTVTTDVDKRTQVLGGARASSGKEDWGLALGTEALRMGVPECPRGLLGVPALAGA